MIRTPGERVREIWNLLECCVGLLALLQQKLTAKRLCLRVFHDLQHRFYLIEAERIALLIDFHQDLAILVIRVREGMDDGEALFAPVDITGGGLARFGSGSPYSKQVVADLKGKTACLAKVAQMVNDFLIGSTQ